MFQRMPNDVRAHVITTLKRFGERRWNDVFAPYNAMQASWMTWACKDFVLNRDMLYGASLEQIELSEREAFPPDELGRSLKEKFESYITHITETGKLPGDYIVAIAVGDKLKLLTGFL